MKSFYFKAIICIVVFTCTVQADSIYTLIQHGKLDEAADSLSQKTSAASRDGNILFYLSLIEESADESARLMEASLRASVSATYRQEIYYRLAQYYLLNEDFKKLNDIVNDYRVRWENGKYRTEMQRLSVLIDEKNKDFDAAIKQIDRYLLEHDTGDAHQWGEIDKARIMQAFNKKVAMRKLLRLMSKEHKGPGVPQSLYLLAEDAIERNNTDDAVFYFNLCREGFPSAIGLEAIIGKLSGMSTSGDRDSKAEARTGTYYTIQVGVYSSSSNAKNRAKEFEQYNKKVRIEPKKISDKNYHVVFVGRFTSYNSALTFKQMLESNYDEAFQVKTE